VEEYLIETDVLADYLSNPEHSLLQTLMLSGTCYTTVFSVSELYEMVSDTVQEDAMKDLLNALHILGIPSRYGLHTKKYEKYFDNVRDRLFCIPAELNKMTIVTGNPDKYRGTGLKIFNQSSEGTEE